MIVDNKLSKEDIEKSKGIFYSVSKRINIYLKEDGLSLNYEGYTDTLNDYINVDTSDLLSIDTLIKELNLWSDYISEVQGIIELYMLKCENKSLYLESLLDKRNPNSKIQKKYNDNLQKYKDYKLYVKMLKGQRKMFIKAYKHCIDLSNKACEQLLYRSNY